MLARTLVLIGLTSVFAVGCSSKEDSTPPVNNVEQDTGPAEEIDAAPWNTYPEGPYGVKRGELYPNLEFEGYKESTGEWTTLKMQDYYDPDGSRGITGIYLVVSAVWCGPCNVEATDMPNWYAKIKERGGRIITTLRDSSKPNVPATRTHLDGWIRKHKLNIDSVIDPLGQATKQPFPGKVCTKESDCATSYGPCKTWDDGTKACWPDALRAWPYNMVIDPRNMRVVSVKSGIDPATHIGCKTSNDCCHVDGDRLGIDVDSTGASYCSKNYVCSLEFNAAGTCVEQKTQSPIPLLETLMVKNGTSAVPIVDAGRPAPPSSDTGSTSTDTGSAPDTTVVDSSVADTAGATDATAD